MLNFYDRDQQSEGGSIAFSMQSGASDGSINSNNPSSDDGADAKHEGSPKKSNLKAQAQELSATGEDYMGGDLSDVGCDSLDAEASGSVQEVDSVRLYDEDTLLKTEADHIPFIKNRLTQEKIREILAASAEGKVEDVLSHISSSDLTCNCTDGWSRSPLHGCNYTYIHKTQHIYSARAHIHTHTHKHNTRERECARLRTRERERERERERDTHA